MALVGFRPIGHLKRRDEMVGRLDGRAGMDTQRLSGSVAARAAMRAGEVVGDVLEGLCAPSGPPDQERAAPCHVCPEEATHHSAPRLGTPIRFRSDVASRPGSAIVEYGASGPLALIEEPTPIARPLRRDEATESEVGNRHRTPRLSRR
jgi:hypothetical protein